MVARRVFTHCPLSARTTTEVSELIAMLSGLVQQSADQNALLAALLRQIGSARPAKASAPLAHQAVLVASGTPVNSPEVPDLHAMILGLVQQSAEQSAAILTGLLCI